MEFEFDPVKSESNLEKHGIDFERAQEIWIDPDRVEIPARTQGEKRWMVIGTLGDSHYSAIITYREGRIRIIAVRASRIEEVKLYED